MPGQLFSQKLRNGRPISYAKFQPDPASERFGSHFREKAKWEGLHQLHPIRAKVNSLKLKQKQMSTKVPNNSAVFLLKQGLRILSIRPLFNQKTLAEKRKLCSTRRQAITEIRDGSIIFSNIVGYSSREKPQMRRWQLYQPRLPSAC